jgi:hypothetical protein
MNRLLHAVNIPEDSLQDPENNQQSRLAKSGLLDSPSGVVEDIASEPGEQALVGTLAGRFSKLTATELEELFSSTLTVPYTVRNGDDTQIDGYYATEQLNIRRGTAKVDTLQQFDGKLVREGTRRSHRRAIKTRPQTVTNPFGSATAPELGLSVRAQDIKWFDAVGGQVDTDPTVVRRVEGEHDFLNIYDASDPPFDDPILVYDIPFTEEYPTDCRIWDTYDRDKIYRQTTTADDTVGSSTVGSATVTDTITARTVQWQRVYSTAHQYQGDTIIENDRLRFEITQSDNQLRAFRYDDSIGLYERVQLGASDWRLKDINITHIGLARIESALTFENRSNGNRQRADLLLIRGLDNATIAEPANASTIPQGVIDRLDPIASDSDRVTKPVADTIDRSDVE